MKRIFCYAFAVILIVCLNVVPVFATDAEKVTEIETESVSELNAEVESGTVTETESETEASLKDSEMWDTLIADLSNDPQFWTLVVYGIVMLLVIIFVLFVLLAHTNPTARKSMNGMGKATKINDDIRTEISQTLGNIKEECSEKNKKILEYQEMIVNLISADKRENRNMLMALAYAMRINKIAIDRLSMPVNDKSIIDEWYARGIEAIKEELSKEDIVRLNSIMAILDGLGKK